MRSLSSSSLVTRWIAVTLGASLVAALDGGWLASWCALAPSKIFHGQLWRLVTWPLVELGPWSLVITCASIYKFGGELVVRWGDKRLLRFTAQIVAAAGVVTCLLAALTGATYLVRLGGWAVCDLLVIAWARQFPERTILLYGLLVLSGQQLIGITIATTVVFAIYFGPVAMAPELVCCLAAAGYPRELLRR
jgi:membrane associated rhomboid family serine protease